MRERLKGQKGRFMYNWQSRVMWRPVGYKLNKLTLSRQFNILHYLACHAPIPIQKKWKNAYSVFHDKHFGSDKASMRYLNKWSCHNWL
jgi:hypothetical protein